MGLCYQPSYTDILYTMALVEEPKFNHILRILNTNIDGKRNITFALTSIKRAGELNDDEVDRVITIMQNPRSYEIPDYFLNRQKDKRDGQFVQLLSNQLDNKLREDIERLKKIRSNRGLRHYWGLRVRGQHTKTTGRRGRTVGVSKKK